MRWSRLIGGPTTVHALTATSLFHHQVVRTILALEAAVFSAAVRRQAALATAKPSPGASGLSGGLSGSGGSGSSFGAFVAATTPPPRAPHPDGGGGESPATPVAFGGPCPSQGQGQSQGQGLPQGGLPQGGLHPSRGPPLAGQGRGHPYGAPLPRWTAEQVGGLGGGGGGGLKGTLPPQIAP